MNGSPRPRATVRISDPLNRQLNMYALAASAAGVGLLALAPPAEAKIVYTSANIRVSGQPLPMDLNHDGIVDFFLFHYYDHSSFGDNALLACLNPYSNGSRTICGNSSVGTNGRNGFRVVESKGYGWGAAVKPGAEIVGGDRFRSGQLADLGQIVFLEGSHKLPRWGGPWVNGGKGIKNRYLGVKFQIKGRFHFGWARMTVTTTSVAFAVTLTGYAYETIPNKGIIAGQTKGEDDSNVEQPDAALTMPTAAPTTLGALALGAPGLSIWRRKEASLDGQ